MTTPPTCPQGYDPVPDTTGTGWSCKPTSDTTFQNKGLLIIGAVLMLWVVFK